MPNLSPWRSLLLLLYKLCVGDLKWNDWCWWWWCFDHWQRQKQINLYYCFKKQYIVTNITMPRDFSWYSCLSMSSWIASLEHQRSRKWLIFQSFTLITNICFKKFKIVECWCLPLKKFEVLMNEKCDKQKTELGIWFLISERGWITWAWC